MNSFLDRSSLAGLVCLVLAALVMVATGSPAARSAATLSRGDRHSAASAFSNDKGRFKVIVNGQQVGKEEFEIGSSGGNWVAHGVAQVQSQQGEAKITGTLNLKADGSPIRYEWSTQGAAKKASATIDFSGAAATVELRLDGARPYTQTFTFNSPRVVVLDNNLYHQYAILARLYDWSQKGPQTFSVLVPQELAPGDVTVEALGKQNVGGANLEELRVKSEDLELHLFLDGQKLMRITAPSSNAEIVRE
jgi:hypothetical protein